MDVNKIVVTDLDNTLWPWIDWAVPALDSMVAYVSEKRNVSVTDVIASLRPIYQQKGTIEYAGVLQDSGLGLSYDDIAEAKRRFSLQRNQGLRLYDGIEETLLQLKKNDVLLVALTDAPLVHATMRLRKLGIEGIFDLLVAVQDPEGNYLPSVQQNILKGKYKPRITYGVVSETKPNVSIGYILQEFYGMLITDQDIVIVGDNPRSDMQLALNHGYRGLYARYGCQSQALVARLLEYTQGPVAARNVSLQKFAVPEGCTSISSFKELVRYILPITI